MTSGVYARTEEMRRKMRGENNPNFGKTLSEEIKKKLSLKLSGENHPMFGKTHSEETKKKMSDAAKGENNSNFGKPPSEETKKKISDSNRGKTRSDETRQKISITSKGRIVLPETRTKISELKKGVPRKPFTQETIDKMKSKVPWNKGLITPMETRIKLSMATKGIPRGPQSPEHKANKYSNKGKKRTPESIAAVSGANSWNWMGGVSFGKYCPLFNDQMKEGVRKLFNYTCQICGHVWKVGEPKLAVHHVYYNKKACCNQDVDGQYIATLPENENVLVKGDPNKFVPLCTSRSGRGCHGKTSHNRLKWALYFEEIINTKYNGLSYIPKIIEEKKQ